MRHALCLGGLGQLNVTSFKTCTQEMRNPSLEYRGLVPIVDHQERKKSLIN